MSDRVSLPEESRISSPTTWVAPVATQILGGLLIFNFGNINNVAILLRKNFDNFDDF